MDGAVGMTYDALTFAIQDKSGVLLGTALLCADVRYASVQWRGTHRPERAWVSRSRWKQILNQIREGLPPKPVDPASPIGELFMLPGYRRGTLNWLHAQPVTIDRVDRTAETLDQTLKAVATSLGDDSRQPENPHD